MAKRDKNAISRKSDAEGEATDSKRGEVSTAVLRALALDYPNCRDREGFLTSDTLKQQFERGGKSVFSESDKLAASRALGRLIRHGAISEVVRLRGKGAKGERLVLEETGIVAITVDIGSIRRSKVATDQECIIIDIIRRGHRWINSESDGKLPVLVPLNISIVHGSGSFDVIMTVMYNDSDVFMKYVRNVIQNTEHVSGTHTMTVSTNYGYPEISDIMLSS